MKCNDKLSKIYVQNNGVLQRSTLSVSLFHLAINDISQVIQAPVKCTLFVDDFIIFFRGINPNKTINYLQNAISALQTWTLVSGFAFSVEKSQCIFFTNKRHLGNTTIIMNNIPIPIKNTTKILVYYLIQETHGCLTSRLSERTHYKNQYPKMSHSLF